MKLKQKVAHAYDGILGLLSSQKRTCPSCGSAGGRKIDRKWFFTLYECDTCALLYSYPMKSTDELQRFYERKYDEGGLTTDIPDDETIARLKESSFAGTFRDVRPVLDIFRVLGLQSQAAILDFGASWGYQTFQFQRYGYRACGYEISRDRAQAGARCLGVRIESQLSLVPSNFDVVYSNHVVEHSGNPKGLIDEMLGRVRPGGYVVCLTPNGSEAYRKAKWKAFHLSWGYVHPVLVTDRFIQDNFASTAAFVGSSADIDLLSSWDQRSFRRGRAGDWELMMILKKPWRS